MKIFKKDLVPDEQFSSVFFVRSVRQGKSKNDCPYLEFCLSDKSGTANGYLWSNLSTAKEVVKEKSFAFVEGVLRIKETSHIIGINQIRMAKYEEIDYSDFTAVTPVGINTLRERLFGLIGYIRDKHCAKLVKSFTEDETLMHLFEHAPGGKRLHHPYIGGLLEHTVNVMTNAAISASIYDTAINKDVLLTGAFLHDIGKTNEIATLPVLHYTDEGNLLGHILIGCNLVNDRMLRIEGFPENLRLHIHHIIASHHGPKENGSLKAPCTAEAIAISSIDRMDAGLNRVEIEMMNNHGVWSPHDNILNKRFYLNKYASFADLAAA